MKQHKAVLLYSEPQPDKLTASKREKQIKGWRREKKLALINKVSLR
jgi:putative endonuclease